MVKLTFGLYFDMKVTFLQVKMEVILYNSLNKDHIEEEDKQVICYVCKSEFTLESS